MMDIFIFILNNKIFLSVLPYQFDDRISIKFYLLGYYAICVMLKYGKHTFF